MPTNLALDDKLLEEALEIGELKTKKDTVNEALHEFIQRRQQSRIVDIFGTIDFDEGYKYKKGRSRR